MKVAFTSCIDAVDDPAQPVWTTIKALAPDVILLLGDIMYMDYGLAILGSRRPLGWPRKVGNDVFAATMHERYKKQWSVPTFRDLLASGPQIGMVWDDHDFAWNNSRGLGSEKYFAVNEERRLIAQGLFRQFRDACKHADASSYPPMPSLEALLAAPEQGIQTSFDRGDVRFIMLDGRSYREDPNIGPDADLLGYAQREWLLQQLGEWDGLVVISSGSVMTGSEESWSRYLDYAWLLGLASGRVLVLSGDIHKNVLPTRHSPSLFEVTSSGAARPGLGGGFAHVGGACGNFGLLTIGEQVAVTLYSPDNPQGAHAIVNFGD
ncbi:MAG TPA: alkaline phosphatase D family protein [Telluria sp.]